MAVLFRQAQMEKEAYQVGQALSSQLPGPVSDIVADYLGLKGKHFTAGLKNKPLSEATLQKIRLEVETETEKNLASLKNRASTAAILLAITASLAILGLVTGGVTLVILGLLGAIPALIVTSINTYRYSQQKKAIDAMIKKLTNTSSHPITPASTITPPDVTSQATSPGPATQNEPSNITPPSSGPRTN
jgi:biopolymer transport protein ExbB/TolQ